MTGQNADPHGEAWQEFWAHDGARGGCLPAGWQGIDLAQRKMWAEFAVRMPQAAKVIDLATGDGRVMAALRAVRSDLDCEGVDRAAAIPPAPAGCRSRGGISMEKLPLADASVGVVTSQFGYEYGATGAAAAEIARVLTAPGFAGLMMHREDGPILEHNLRRRDEIIWATEEMNLIERAKDCEPATALTGDLGAAPQQGEDRFGARSAAWEIAEAVRRTLELGAGDDPDQRSHVLETIASRARNELGRIDSLAAACAAASDTARLEAEWQDAGLKLLGRNEVCEPGGRAFADFYWLVME